MTDRQIKVSNLPRNVSEDLLSNFFENPRIFGNDLEVESVQLRAGKAVVTFTDEAHVDLVLGVHAKKGCKLLDREIDIQKVTTNKSAHRQSYTQSQQDDDDADDGCESSTIEVQGLSDSITDELVWNYFENPFKAGGGEIVDLKRTGKTAYIKYRDKQVVHKVLQRSHTLSGCSLSVTLLIISKDALLLSNIPPDVTEEMLSNYIEAKLKEEVVCVTFDQEQTKALVTFQNDIDFQSAQRECSQSLLKGISLHVQEVPESSSVMVTNMADKETQDSIMYYFENRNKSGGGPVKGLEMCEEEDYCLVHFEEAAVAIGVCQKKDHTLSGAQLKVQPYNRILGVPYGGSQPVFKLPHPVNVGQKQTQILTLIKQRCHESINAKFESVQAKMDWGATPLQINCMLTEADKNCRVLAKAWTKKVVATLEGFTNNIEIYTCPVSEPVWNQAKIHLQSMEDIRDPDRTVLKYTKSELILVAPKQDIAEIKDKIKKAIETSEMIIKKQNERATEEIDLKSSWKADYLNCIGFSKTVSVSKETSTSSKDEVEVSVDTERKKVMFTGPKENITKAKLHMYDELNRVKSQTLKLAPGKVTLLKRPFIYKIVCGKVSEYGAIGVFKIMDDTVTVHGTNEESQKQIEDILNQMLVCIEHHFNKNSLKTFRSTKWDQFKDNLCESCNGCIAFELIDERLTLLVFTLKDLTSKVRDQLKEFLDKNTTVNEIVNFKDEDAVKFVERFCKDDIRQAIEKCHCEVRYKFDNTKLVLTGTEEDNNTLSRFFKGLVSRVQSQTFPKREIGIQKYLSCKAGKECIEKLEASTGCVIHVVTGGRGPLNTGHDGRVQERKQYDATRSCSEITLYGNVKVKVEAGDLTKQHRDVIVITASKTLQFRGRLHDIISEKGGEEIAEDCHSRINDRGVLLEGEVYLSTAGSLPCKAIAHAVIAGWKPESGETGSLVRVVENCLRKSDKKGYQSIVIPGLGTGNLHYPLKVACKTIVKTIKTYFEQVSTSTLKEVVLCDMNRQTLQMFESCLADQTDSDDDHEQDDGATGASEDYYMYSDIKRARSVDDEEQRRPRGNTGVSVGHVQIKVVIGHLAEERVDVIIDSAPNDLHLKKGRCSGALLAAGGHRIQQECNSNYPDGIEMGEVAVTTGGKLKCRQIYHIALMSYNEGNRRAIMGLRTSLEKCLQLADNDGYTSISIPSLGTGSMKFPGQLVAREMFSCISRYFQNNSSSSLTKVRLVVFPKDAEAKEAFQAEERRLSGNSGTDDEDAEVIFHKSGTHDNSAQIEIMIQGVKVILVKAPLAREKVDVIVNSTAPDLRHDRGQCSKAILKAAGSKLQLECQQNFPDGITVGQVAVTSPGNLKCQKVFHIGVPKFEKDNGEASMQGLCSCVNQCLVTANKMGFKTISFPPIGIGFMRYPKGWVAAKTLSSIDDFLKQNSKRSVTTIRLVIYPDDNEVYQAFRKEVSKRGPVIKGDSGKTNHGPSKQGNKSENLQSFMAKEKNECMLKICSDNAQKIADANRSFDSTFQREWCVKKYTDEAISTLRQDKVKTIKEEFKKHSVHAHIDIDAGCIFAYGLARNLLDISEKIDEILKKQHKYMSTKKEATLMKNMVRWFYIVNQKTIPFGDIDSLNIEKAYKNKDATYKVRNRSGQTFVIDFQKMCSHEASQPSQTTAVIRRDVMSDASGTVPSNWTVPGGKSADNVALISLATGSQEYNKVLAEFQRSLGRTPNIIKIERVQNKMLYTQYAAKLQSINTQNKSTNNVKVLWHGTDSTTVPSIYTHGFNRSFCNSCSIGNGVYFAVNASYSDGGYARPDASGHKRMFRCLVITGQSTQGQSGMRVPPKRATNGNTPVFYDSVTDSTGSPSMFVIFHDCQAYPEHLITYT